ncbi:UNVERIFIED_CONTAM: hypothetical protein GTU68_028699 [Idotea baltica]|nr:hypothetical protein [Idotea baltica]
MLKEFKNFIMTGNVIDLAVAVILAGAIGLVVSGFVGNIMMPIVGHFAGGLDFADLKVVLDPDAIKYGVWINSIINLITVGIVLFMIVRAYNKTKEPVAAPAPAGPSELDILKEIRDSLKK